MKYRPTVLLVAAAEDTGPFVGLVGQEQLSLLHLPLEIYVEAEQNRQQGGLGEALEKAENIVYGYKRNAEFLMRHANTQDLYGKIKKRVNLAADQFAEKYLEGKGIPAVYPGSDKPVKMVEFMLRLRRTGPTLYPCGGHQKEEIPGLLRELDIPVTEYVLFEMEGPSAEELENYREQISNSRPDFVICHSRRSVTRIWTAFPDLEYENLQIIAGDRAVAGKLTDLDRKADFIAEGTWKSIYNKVKAAL